MAATTVQHSVSHQIRHHHCYPIRLGSVPLPGRGHSPRVHPGAGEQALRLHDVVLCWQRDRGPAHLYWGF
uniref:Uncharacterized protein n=1 Tax=Macrostomum lignano TaxID=282301 RepID=A0A1I8HW00_9PLAT